MNYYLLKALLPYLENFENSHDTSEKLGIKEFSQWLSSLEIDPQAQNTMKTYQIKASTTKNSAPIPPQGDNKARIAQLLALMYKYLKFYLRKGFEKLPLSSPDDFGFLATLMLEGEMRKNVLIEKNTMEFTSGMEVIRRLERHGFIESKPDPNDKRAKLVFITNLGKRTFIQITPSIKQIGSIVVGPLSIAEQELLLSLLTKLNHFHSPIFQTAKKEDIESIIKHYLEPD